MTSLLYNLRFALRSLARNPGFTLGVIVILGLGRQISATPGNITHPVDLDRMLPTLRLFGAAVILLLVITCANVAHLLLARSSSRTREMAVRQSALLAVLAAAGIAAYLPARRAPLLEPLQALRHE